MTVKAFVWKDIMPVALPISVEYDNKYNSGTLIVAPDTNDYILNIGNGDINTDGTKDNLLDYTIPDVSSNVVNYPVTDSTGQIDSFTTDGIVGEMYDDSYDKRTPIGDNVIPADEYDKYVYIKDIDSEFVDVSNQYLQP